MQKFRALAIFLTLGFLLTGCVTKSPKNYSAFRAENPRSILIVPAVNRSYEVTAADYYLATISVPLAERGYYVFPIHTVKRILEEDGLSDANLVHEADAQVLGSLFGADAVLYVTIEKWRSQYAVFATTTEVEFSYVLKSGSTGEEVWSNNEKMIYTPQDNTQGLAGLIVKAIQAAMEKAAPNYMPLARQANSAAILTAGQGLPAGPYSEQYLLDDAQFSSTAANPKKDTAASK